MTGVPPITRVLRRTFAIVTILFVCFGLRVPAAVQRSGGTSGIALTHVTVIDGTGAVPQPDQTVVIAGQRITAVGPSSKVKVSRGVQTIDARGKYLIPGLWDTHVHTRYDGIDHLRLFIVNGITSVRDMGGPWTHLETMKLWREQIATGKRVGPRIWMAGPLLDGSGSRWSHAAVISNAEEGRQTVQRLKREGADFVKVYDLLSRESFFAIVDEAHALGMYFVGHVPTAITVKEASEAGQRSIEHAFSILRDIPFPRLDSPEAEVLASQTATDIFNTLKRNHTVVVPTLSYSWTGLGVARRDPLVIEADRLKYVPSAYVKEWKAGPASNLDETFLKRQTALTHRLHQEGIPLLAGTDVVKPYFVPGFALHDELLLLVEAGLTPSEAIQAASRVPARFMGRKDVGTIEPGMLADVVLLNADPLKEIANTRQIAAVVANGRLFDGTALKAMQMDIEESARTWKGTPTGR